MNFQEQLKQQLAQQNRGERAEVDYPSNHLKHKELFIPKETNQVLVRILPPSVSGENYNQMVREIFLQAHNRNGKELKLNAVLSAFPNVEDPLDQALINWNAQNRVPNKWNKNATPTKKYLANVIQLIRDPQTGQFRYETDEQGNLMVRLFKLSHSACQAINAKLTDTMLTPNFNPDVPDSVKQYSFISSAEAFPVMISKPAKGSGQMSYGVDVYSNMPLGALPQGWETQLEDLAYQATPSYSYNKEYIDYFIDVVNGVEPVSQAQGGQQAQPQQGYQAPAMGQGFASAPQQPAYNMAQPQQPMNTGFNQQPVAPVQPQATNMGTPSFGQTNMGTAPTMNGGFAQAPQQPVQPAPIADLMGFQMPMNQAPVTDPSTISDADMPFNMQAMPDVTPQATSVPEQPVVATPEPPQQAPVAPVETATNTTLPDVDSLLQQMQG